MTNSTDNNSFFPTDPKKIRERIRRYERAFKNPNHDDGAGKRFLLGQLYMLLGDVEGAAKSYRWYKEAFPDDVPEAFNHLCWTLVLLRSGDEKNAKIKFRELVFNNLYIVPIFLGQAPTQYNFRHYSNWSEIEYIMEGPMHEIFSLWNESECAWLRLQWDSAIIQKDIAEYVALQKRLDESHDHKTRKQLIDMALRVAKGQHLKIVGSPSGSLAL